MEERWWLAAYTRALGLCMRQGKDDEIRKLWTSPGEWDIPMYKPRDGRFRSKREGMIPLTPGQLAAIVADSE